MVDQGRSDFYVVLTMSLCILESKQMFLGSYMRLTCKYELHILSNAKVSLARVHGKNYMKLRLLLAHHLLCNHLLLFLRSLKQAPLQKREKFQERPRC